MPARMCAGISLPCIAHHLCVPCALTQQGSPKSHPVWRHQATPARKSCNNTCFISFQLLARRGSAAAGSGVSAPRTPPNQPPGPAPGSAQAPANVYKAVYHIDIMRFTRAIRPNMLPWLAHWTPYMYPTAIELQARCLIV